MDGPIADIRIWPDGGITDLGAEDRLLGSPELRAFTEAWALQRERLKGTNALRRFTTEMNREWAIETGILENLYELDRGVTETLIEQGFEADLLARRTAGRPRDYVVALLRDQQDALESVFDFVTQRRSLTTGYIKELHAALLRSQHDVEALDPQGRPVSVELIRGTYKLHPNYPERDGKRFLYCPPEHVAAEMDRLVAMHDEHTNAGVPPEVEAAWLHHRFSQIHPFHDGNGRVGRALASLVLIQAELLPLVVTRDDKVAYLDALEQADAGSLGPLVGLFAQLLRAQFRLALAISEAVLDERRGVTEALAGLEQSVGQRAEDRLVALASVFDTARALEEVALARFTEVAPQVAAVLRGLDPIATVVAERSDQDNNSWFRAQIIEAARNWYHYYADTSTYSAWVRLSIRWERRAQLVVAFHSTGTRFAGVMVAAPFLEYRDEGEDGSVQPTLVRVADEPFEFAASQPLGDVQRRFADWLEQVLAVAVAELRHGL